MNEGSRGSAASSTTSQNHILSKINSNFRPALIQECLKLNLTNSKTKISNDAVDLMNKIAKILTIEALMRATSLAKSEGKPYVHLDHVELILPQLMLDFP
ncbi:centromere protein x [Holotrichia oblita]|uniref:Centromere protein x n=1 Tax=Holotrichia oblita TaxID=644536 RepID=A0ACB9TM78_HOLOL|nr:centromere protein x [Holotrichia oblita]